MLFPVPYFLQKGTGFDCFHSMFVKPITQFGFDFMIAHGRIPVDLSVFFTRKCTGVGTKNDRMKGWFLCWWANGRVERMNGTIKDATVKKYI
ncbi:hypothetical protein SAMN05421882_101115 [Nitrosomonas communis]|uniref:Uncharacterized protein n=1 Tax=Nitrosomonas communis TaxID=44574 RepID=A0A1H2TJ69_9PROT|nr:hypothetical protein SAMN05421882_101115 [Nitrosomonas communis]